MKKIFLFVGVLLLLSSCTVRYQDPRETVKDPKAETTIRIQELPADTVLMAIDGSDLYIFDKDTRLVIVKMKSYDESMAHPRGRLETIFFYLFLCAVMGIFIIKIITEN